MARPQFEVVEDDETSNESHDNSTAASLLALSLKALSQRAIVALESLFTLVTVVLVFWLGMSIADPNTHQIVWFSIFAVFVLAANVIVRRIK